MEQFIAMTADLFRQRSLKAAAPLPTFFAFCLHLNLSAATSLHLFLMATIALRWGFLEVSVVSIPSVACLDYLSTEPLFVLSIADGRDWIAMTTFEAAWGSSDQISGTAISIALPRMAGDL